jgi:large conductance mechanosensitive channel
MSQRGNRARKLSVHFTRREYATQVFSVLRILSDHGKSHQIRRFDPSPPDDARTAIQLNKRTATQTKNEGGIMLKEFRDFISRGNVIDLAIGIIIGAAFTTIVNSLVKDIIMPPVGKLTGGVDFSNIFIDLSGNHYSSLAAAQQAGAATINVGLFLNAVVNFVIVAFVIFILMKQVNRFWKKEEAKPTPPPRTEVLLEEIRDLLRNR